MINSLKNLFTDETEYIETDELDEMTKDEEQVDETFKVDSSSNKVNQSSKGIVKVFEPVSKTATSTIIDSIKRGELCIVNLAKVSEEEASVIYSTLSGSIYSLDGVLKMVDQRIMLCSPKNYLVDGDLTE